MVTQHPTGALPVPNGIRFLIVSDAIRNTDFKTGKYRRCRADNAPVESRLKAACSGYLTII